MAIGTHAYMTFGHENRPTSSQDQGLPLHGFQDLYLDLTRIDRGTSAQECQAANRLEPGPLFYGRSH